MPEKKQKKNISLKFLGVVIILYAFVAFFNEPLFVESIRRFWEIIYKIIPLFGLIVVLMFLTNKYITAELVKKHLANESGLKAYFFTILAGIIISGPPYVLFPLLKDLKQKGMSDNLIAVFLYNRNIKIPFLPAMVYYFGLAVTLLLSFYIIIFSVLNGLLIQKIMSNNKT